MKKIGKTLIAMAMVSLLFGCGGQQQETAESEQFVVGMECSYAPFNWQTSQESETTVSLGNAGYADGYDVQIAKRIADDLGKELVIKKISWDGLSVALESGEIDAIIAGMTADEEREKGIDFTTPYYQSEMVMIVRGDDASKNYTDIQQFSGKTIVGQMSTSYDTVIDQINGVDHATPKQSYPEMLVALQSGEVDGITAELPVAQGILETNQDLAIVRFEQNKGFKVDTAVSIGLKEGSRNSTLFKKVQKCIDNISSEKRNEMMGKYSSSQPKGE